MASIGIEYVDTFDNYRAITNKDVDDLSTPYYIANWFGPYLADAGHEIRFLRHNQFVGERHMRALSLGGEEATFADRVDLYFVLTHGVYENGQLILLYDTQLDDFQGYSGAWQFGDNCNMEWLLIFGCHSIKSDSITDHHHIFNGLHLFCGSYGWMYDSWTVCEAGADTADNLIAGMTVCDSWIDGVSDWWVENHPMVISVEKQETWRNGNPDWPKTVLKSDHLWGHGTTRADIPRAQHYWMAANWCDSGVWDYG